MFLEKLLPDTGLYCVAMLLPRGGFRHFFFDNLDAAQTKLGQLDASRLTSYIAQATFDPAKIAEAKAHNAALPKGLDKTEWKARAKKLRSQDNALLIKNFFLDIDCGEKWPLKNQIEGIHALKEFISDTNLPFPVVINSGNGLYAHWILRESIPAAQWRTIAFILKQVVKEYSPKIGGDSSRTSDSASVLRPPGVTNRKEGRPEKQVVILKDSEPIEFLEFVDILKAAAKKKKINHSAALAPKPNTDINADFFGGLEQKGAPCDAEKIAEKCAQIGLMKETAGDITEPLWYACIGVLVHCEDGESFVHRWSNGHPEYNSADTDSKIQQWHNAGVGPSTCASLGAINGEKCIGCPHNGKIKSPIVLGRPEPKAKELPKEECEPPDGFRRGIDGLFAEEDGRWVRFYDQDLYLDRLAYDESLGHEVMTIKHSLPYEGDLECTLRSSLVNDPKALMTTLSDNHIKVVGMKEKKYMTAYLESYQARIQRSRRMTLLLCQMGWKEARNGNPIFVLGKNIFHADGSVEEASLARNVPSAAMAYHCKGSLEKWSAATKLLDAPGMEPFAFALLAGGFGAPLMKFTGFSGALVSLVGGSGSGKSLIQYFIQSVWGNHIKLIMLRDDTRNSLVSRLGVIGNLPLTIDEITNIDGMELSDLVYRITQGRDKVRLTKNAVEKSTINEWNTLAVTSSNSSLIDKLSGAKHDASAEINRVFEYAVNKNANFCDKVTTNLYWTIYENYGYAGVEYARWMVTHVDDIKTSLDKVRERIDCTAEIRGEERFWGAVASASIYGGLVAQKLGLIQFDVSRVMSWVSDTIFNMRGDKNELTGDSLGILAQFLDVYAANRLIVKGDPRSTCVMIETPHGSLVIRYEVDCQRLYFSRAVFKQWISKRFGSYTQIKNDLMGLKILINPNKRKTLGAGTHYGGAQQPCWEINMRNHKLGQLDATAKLLAGASQINLDALGGK